MLLTLIVCLSLLNGLQAAERLVFFDDFNSFDLKTWKHDLTLSGGGNWEFQVYHNNRTNSFVKNGALHIKPTLLEERIGESNLRNGFTMDLWGGSPVDQCTGNNFYGCQRTSGRYFSKSSTTIFGRIFNQSDYTFDSRRWR